MNRKYLLAPVALAVPALALAACSSSPTTGHETLNGATSNIDTSTVPLAATGIAADHGTITLNGSNGAGKGVVKLSKGDIDVQHSNTKPVNSASGSTAESVSKGTYRITGGTGAYAGASGSGDFVVVFRATYPPNTQPGNPNAQPTSGQISFHASGTWTLP